MNFVDFFAGIGGIRLGLEQAGHKCVGLCPNEYALLDKGWVYRTCKEAQAALPKVAAEMGVEYEL